MVCAAKSRQIAEFVGAQMQLLLDKPPSVSPPDRGLRMMRVVDLWRGLNLMRAFLEHGEKILVRTRLDLDWLDALNKTLLARLDPVGDERSRSAARRFSCRKEPEQSALSAVKLFSALVCVDLQ